MFASLVSAISVAVTLLAPATPGQIVDLRFEGGTTGQPGTAIHGAVGGSPVYVEGLDGRAIAFSDGDTRQYVCLGAPAALSFGEGDDFTVQIWVRTRIGASSSPVLMSNSDLRPGESDVFGGIYGEQKLHDGWALYARSGTWGFNMGDGVRNYAYEPFPGTQVLNDGEWHQLAFSHTESENSLRVYFDGVKRAIIEISDLREGIASDLPTCIAVDGRADESAFDAFVGAIDNVAIWDRALADEEVAQMYARHFEPAVPPAAEPGDPLTLMAWNIWHGGTHFRRERDGFDGAERVAEIIRQLDADVVMMQETYGAGPKIASILGYEIMIAGSLFSDTVWGSNITVLSRFPIKRGFVVGGLPVYNGGAQITVGDGRDIIAFSNWYSRSRTRELVTTLEHWSALIANADAIPLFWGGDFNSASHLDGETETNHSRLMTDAGFIDAFREVNEPERRIDYLYYKGAGVRVVHADMLRAEDLARYPSDHPIVLTRFVAPIAPRPNTGRR